MGGGKMNPPPPLRSTSSTTTGGLEALLLAVFSVVAIFTGRRCTDVVGGSAKARVLQIGMLGFAALGFAYVGSKLLAPSADAVSSRSKRVDQAVATGKLSLSWYVAAETRLNNALLVLVTAIAAFLLHAWSVSFPSSPVDYWGDWLQAAWTELRASYTEPWLFCGGLFIIHMATFWTASLFYAVLDFTRPTVLEQFKVQPKFVLTAVAFRNACLKALGNQLLSILLIVGVYLTLPSTAPLCFAAELPSLTTVLIQFVAIAPFAEAWFYFTHIALHSEWAYANIHYVHHSWTAPIAVVSVYAHPIEHLFGSVPTLLLGPLIIGPHWSVWALWTAFATLNTIGGHTGWHFPFGGPINLFQSPEGHDFHHSHFTQNYGVLGILDAFFGTSKTYATTWYAKVDKTYTTPDYAVDRILLQPVEE